MSAFMEYRKRPLQTLCLIALYVVLIAAGQAVSGWALTQLGMDLRPSTQGTFHAMVMAVIALYVILLALPFVPGVEIGFGLLTMLGPSICFLVYLSTVTALILVFAIGRLVPPDLIVAIFRRFKLVRASELVARLAPMSIEERLAFLFSRGTGRPASVLLRHRYLALAILLNLPGNALVGGGGGIALAAGISRLFPFPAFLLTVALAVAPLPLAFFLTNGFR